MYLGSYKELNGYEFEVYAPNAKEVQLSFGKHKEDMVKTQNGSWVKFVDNIADGTRYSYIIDGIEKIDLFARKVVEHRKNKPTAVTYSDSFEFKNQKVNKEVSKIYEVYLDKVPGGTLSFKTKYIIDNAEGYSHIQIMPFQYTPNKMTLGYKTSSYFAINPDLGELRDFKQMIDDLHSNGFGVILDYCFFEFEEFSDNGLLNYDGTALVEYDDRRQHPTFTGYLFDIQKPFTQTLINSVVDFYLNDLNADGIRFDGINELIFQDQIDQKELKEDNLKFFKNLIDKLDPSIIIICDLITHRTLEELGLERINHIEGSLLQFQLHKIFKLGERWFAENRNFELNFLSRTLDMIKNSKVLVTINHDVHITGLQGVMVNNDLKDEATSSMYKMILYAIPKPKQLWFNIDLNEDYVSDLDDLIDSEFDFNLYQNGNIDFIYKKENKKTTLSFGIFQNKIELKEELMNEETS